MQASRFIARLLLPTLLAVPALAQGAKFKSALPSTTLLYASFPDILTTLKEFKSTPLFKMWMEKEMQTFFAGALEMAEQKYDEALEKAREAHKAGQFPFDPDELLKLRVTRASVALTSFDVEVERKPSGRPRPHPKVGVLAYVDFGATADKWQKVIEFGAKALEMEGGDHIKRSKSDVEDGLQLHSLDIDESVMGIHWAFHGSGLVIGTLKSEIQATLKNMVHGTASFTENDSYRNVAQNLPLQGAEVEFFMQPRRVVDRVMSIIKLASKEAPDFPEDLDVDGLDRAVTAFGLRSIRGIGLASRYEGGKSVSKIYAHSPKQERKGLFAADAGPLDMKFLPWVPIDAANFTATSFNAMTLYDSIVGAAKAYDPEQANQALQMLAQQEEKLGISVKDDLFGAFDNQFIWWSMGIMNFMQAPEWGILIKVKNQDSILKVLNMAAQMTQGAVELTKSKRRGITTWRLELDPELLDEGQDMVLSMLQPCFTFKDGYMVAALTPGHVRRAVKRMNAKPDGPNVLQNPAYAAYKDSIPSGVNSLGWADYKAAFENFYQAGTSLLMLVPKGDDIPFDMKQLPEGETLSKHLFGEVSYGKTDENGFSYTTIGPVGTEVYLGVGAAIGAGAMFFLARDAAAPGMVIREPVEELEEEEMEEEIEVEDVKKTDKDKKKKGKDKELPAPKK